MSAKTVLVTDDEPHIRYMLEFKLSRAGYGVVTASSGPEAFELARRHRPALVVTDFQMPGGDGLELCRQLRRHPDTQAIPAIMLTARGHRVPAGDLAQTNIRRVVSKPFSPRELLQEIEELLAEPTDGAETGDRGAAA